MCDKKQELFDNLLKQAIEICGTLKEGTPLFKLTVANDMDMVHVQQMYSFLAHRVKALIPDAVIICMPGDTFNFELVNNKTIEEKIKNLELKIETLENVIRLG